MLLNALLWLDIQVMWLIAFGNCRKGETISAASWSLYLDGKWQGRVAVPVIDFLFSPWQRQHCCNAYQWQIEIYQG